MEDVLGLIFVDEIEGSEARYLRWGFLGASSWRRATTS